MTEKTAHKHSFPVQPPRGSWSDPGPCECGKTWARSQAERAIEEAAAAVSDKTPRDETALQLLDANEQLAARVTELESERKQLREAITAMADKSGLEAASAARFRDDAIDGGNEELAGRWNIRHELHAIHAGWLRMLAAS
jgi:hypothetical protein